LRRARRLAGETRMHLKPRASCALPTWLQPSAA
jgi:hypothetical protein